MPLSVESDRESKMRVHPWLAPSLADSPTVLSYQSAKFFIRAPTTPKLQLFSSPISTLLHILR